MSGHRTSGRAWKSAVSARVWGSGCSVKAGRPVGRGQHEMRVQGRDFERKMEISGSKLTRFCGGKMGKLGEMLDPLETKQIQGSKSTKLHQTNKSQKKLGLFLVGIFEFREEHNKTRLEKRGVGAPKT